MSGKRGFTLPEMIIYAGFLILCLGVIYAVFTLSMQNYYSSAGSADVQQSAETSFKRFIGEFQETDPASISYTSSPTVGVVFESARNASNIVQYDSSSGLLIWQKYVCYYLASDPNFKGENILFRKELAITPTTTPQASSCTPDNFRTGSTGCVSTIKNAIANHVNSFTVVPSSNCTSCNVSFRFATSAHGKTNSFTMNNILVGVEN